MAMEDYKTWQQAALIATGAYPFIAAGETYQDIQESKAERTEREDKSKTKKSKSKAEDREKNAESGLVEAQAESENAQSYGERIAADAKLAAAHAELEAAREASALAGAAGTRAQTMQWALLIGGVLTVGGLAYWATKGRKK